MGFFYAWELYKLTFRETAVCDFKLAKYLCRFVYFSKVNSVPMTSLVHLKFYLLIQLKFVLNRIVQHQNSWCLHLYMDALNIELLILDIQINLKSLIS